MLALILIYWARLSSRMLRCSWRDSGAIGLLPFPLTSSRRADTGQTALGCSCVDMRGDVEYYYYGHFSTGE